jgi:tetratricopeptide (TPR) repeat protein
MPLPATPKPTQPPKPSSPKGTMKKFAILATIVLIAGVAGVAAVRSWRQTVLERQEARAFEKAKDRLREGAPAEAFALAQTQARPGTRLDWRGVELEALVGMRDLGRIAQIYDREPARVLMHEEASVLAARAYLHSRKGADAEKVRKAWRGREKKYALWLVFDADTLTLAGKPKEAEALLRSKTLPGKDDAARLQRLAVLAARRNLGEAWKLLGQAVAIDTHDADLRLLRGQVLEGAGKIDAARFEYVAALVCRTNDAFMRDELAEFYRRQGNFPLALETWTEVMPDHAPDYFWLKAGFWAKMIQPTKLDADTIPQGDLQPLAEWMLKLPEGRCFDTNSFDLLPESRRYAADRQEVYWLQLVDTLQSGHEKAAFDLLSFNRFRAASWAPELENALLRILLYRAKHSLDASAATVGGVTSTNQHIFLQALNAAARDERAGRKPFLSAELDATLRGPDAFVAAFLSAGWREAALALHRPGHDAAAHPGWLSYGLAQVLRSNRGAANALEFLSTEKPTPETMVIAGECLIQLGKNDEGLARLATVAGQPNAAGQRASYILALASMDQNKMADAKKWVTSQPLLANATIGKELLGRMAAADGNFDDADRVFGSIAAESVEARAHLARRAFAKKDWKSARRYTEELMVLLPDQIQLRENLKAIDDAEVRR